MTATWDAWDDDTPPEDFDDHSDCEQCTGYSDYPDEPTRVEIIRNTIADTVSKFLYYDRKEDESLPRGAIEDAIASGEITVEDIVAAFENELRAGLA